MKMELVLVCALLGALVATGRALTFTVTVTAGSSESDCDRFGDEPVWAARVNNEQYTLFDGDGYDCLENPEEDGPKQIFSATYGCSNQLTSIRLCLAAGDDDRIEFGCGAVFDKLNDLGDLGCVVERCENLGLGICPGGDCSGSANVQFNVEGDDSIKTKRVNFLLQRFGSCPTPAPTKFPTVFPSERPTHSPTVPGVTIQPTTSPTEKPSLSPTFFGQSVSPTFAPSVSPETPAPTENPLPCAQRLEQCAGLFYSGPTCCAKGLECREVSASQSFCDFQKISTTSRPTTENEEGQSQDNGGDDESPDESSQILIFGIVGAVCLVVVAVFVGRKFFYPNTRFRDDESKTKLESFRDSKGWRTLTESHKLFNKRFASTKFSETELDRLEGSGEIISTDMRPMTTSMRAVKLPSVLLDNPKPVKNKDNNPEESETVLSGKSNTGEIPEFLTNDGWSRLS